MGIDLYSAAQVLDVLHIRYNGNKRNVKVVCPSCGSNNFYFSLEKNTGKCWSCGFHANSMSYYAVTQGISNKEANTELIGMFASNSSISKPDANVSPVSKFAEQVDMASIEKRDAVYRVVLDCCRLSTKNCKDLHERGLTDEEIEKFGYGTYNVTDDDCYRIARVVQRKGLNPKGVPGFYQDSSHEWRLRKLKRGILIPYMSQDRLIQQLQIRKDEDTLKWYKNSKGVLKKEKKCMWLSSNDCEMGTPCINPLSFGTEFGIDFVTGKQFPILDKTIIIIEGGMKGDITHAISGFPVISVVGVNAIGELEKILSDGTLRSYGVETIYNGYDMDYLTNANVRDAVSNLEALIKKNGFGYKRALWKQETPEGPLLKGMDDYYAYHKRGIVPKH